MSVVDWTLLLQEKLSYSNDEEIEEEEEQSPIKKKRHLSNVDAGWARELFNQQLIGGPGPLSLNLKKSPSLLELVQKELDQATKVKRKQDTKSSEMQGTKHSKKLTASHFHAFLLRIGDWEWRSRYKGDLVANFYFSTRKIVWEIMHKDLKSKMEIKFSDICALKVTYPKGLPGTLDITVSREPYFFRETNLQPCRSTRWDATRDFTGGQAGTLRHVLHCDLGIIDKHIENLFCKDHRLHLLSQENTINPESPLDPYHTDDGNQFGIEQIAQPLPLNPMPTGTTTGGLNHNGASSLVALLESSVGETSVVADEPSGVSDHLKSDMFSWDKYFQKTINPESPLEPFCPVPETPKSWSHQDQYHTDDGNQLGTEQIALNHPMSIGTTTGGLNHNGASSLGALLQSSVGETSVVADEPSGVSDHLKSDMFSWDKYFQKTINPESPLEPFCPVPETPKSWSHQDQYHTDDGNQLGTEQIALNHPMPIGTTTGGLNRNGASSLGALLQSSVGETSVVADEPSGVSDHLKSDMFSWDKYFQKTINPESPLEPFCPVPETPKSWSHQDQYHTDDGNQLGTEQIALNHPMPIGTTTGGINHNGASSLGALLQSSVGETSVLADEPSGVSDHSKSDIFSWDKYFQKTHEATQPFMSNGGNISDKVNHINNQISSGKSHGGFDVSSSRMEPPVVIRRYPDNSTTTNQQVEPVNQTSNADLGILFPNSVRATASTAASTEEPSGRRPQAQLKKDMFNWKSFLQTPCEMHRQHPASNANAGIMNTATGNRISNQINPWSFHSSSVNHSSSRIALPDDGKTNQQLQVNSRSQPSYSDGFNGSQQQSTFLQIVDPAGNPPPPSNGEMISQETAALEQMLQEMLGDDEDVADDAPGHAEEEWLASTMNSLSCLIGQAAVASSAPSPQSSSSLQANNAQTAPPAQVTDVLRSGSGDGDGDGGGRFPPSMMHWPSLP